MKYKVEIEWDAIKEGEHQQIDFRILSEEAPNINEFYIVALKIVDQLISKNKEVEDENVNA